MKKKITRLVCAGMASCCVLMAAEQEKATRIVEKRPIPQEEIKLRADGKERPDSVVRYDDRGYITNVYYSVGTEGAEFYYDDYYECWASSDDHFHIGLWPEADYDVKYNSRGLVETLTYPDFSGDINDYRRVQFQYNENGYLLSDDSYIRPINSPASPWEHISHTTYFYDSYDNWVGVQNYYVEDGVLVPFDTDLYTVRVDSKGRIVYSERYNGEGGSFGTPDGHRSKFIYYIWYYSDHTPNAEVEKNTSVAGDNQGSFDLNVNVPTDSISSGSVTVTFPEGFTLDEENTSLTLDFAADFTLTITKQENNSWLLEIKPKALRSAPLRADEVQKAIQIAYQVDEEAKRGSYDISVNSILFTTPTGNIIPEPAITVPVNVNRWGVANEGIEDANTVVYITGNTLYIQTPQSETITVYAINGSKLYEATVPSGTVTVDASAFPQGVLIVKGSSGWVKKIVKNF